MPPIKLDPSILDYDTIKSQPCDNGDVSNCTHPAGHCFGSDGGSGIPLNLKVAPGRGGVKEIWTLSSNKQSILSMALYEQCQYCLKYNYAGEKTKEGLEI